MLDAKSVGTQRLDLPDTGAAHAAILLQDDGAVDKPSGQIRAELLEGAIEVGRRAPAHPGCGDQHLLRRHAGDHVRMSRYPDAALRDLPKERIELRAVEAFLDRVHPDEDAVQPEQVGTRR